MGTFKPKKCDCSIDLAVPAFQNESMSIDATNSISVDPQELADSRAVMEHVLSQAPLDPEVYRRVHERAAKITEDLRRKHGTLDIAVDLIREVRDEG
jgi:hypothetical protein